MKCNNLFAIIPYLEDATIKEWLGLIYRNFDKSIKLLIAIYGKHCVICDNLSPLFITDSGTSEHYWTRHKKSTALFVLNNLMTKNADQVHELIDHEN